MKDRRQFVPQFTAILFTCGLIIGFLPGFAAAQDLSTQSARTVRAGAIVPLDGPVLAGKPVTFKLSGNPSNPHWDLGDGVTADGSSVSHTYQKPGVYRVVMGSKVGGTFNELSSAIVRVHTPETMHLPQVLLDTDARNEVGDQHYIAYALFSELDVLAITSTGWIKEGGSSPNQLLQCRLRTGAADIQKGLPLHGLRSTSHLLLGKRLLATSKGDCPGPRAQCSTA